MNSKIYSLELCLKLAKKDNKKVEADLLLEVKNQNREESVLILEEKKKAFSNLWEMVSEAIGD